MCEREFVRWIMICCVMCLQEEPDIPFTEEDYRRRRPHPNFKEQIAAEKLTIKLGKTVCSPRLSLSHTHRQSHTQQTHTHSLSLIPHVFSLIFNVCFKDKTKLCSYVIAAGLLYGAGEGIFHFLFKVSFKF